MTKNIQSFDPDVIIPAVEHFRDTDYKTWCKRITLKGFSGIDDPLFSDINNMRLRLIRNNYFNFRSLANQLRKYVTASVKGLNDSDRQMVYSHLFNIKKELDRISSVESIDWFLDQMNKAVMKYCIRVEDLVYEDTGEVITERKFSKRVGYANEQNYYVYQIYFWAAIRELSNLLQEYQKKYENRDNIGDTEYFINQKPTEFKSALREVSSELSKNKKSSERTPPKYICLIADSDEMKNKIIDEMHRSLYPERINVSLKEFQKHFINSDKDYTKMEWCSPGIVTSLKLFFDELLRSNIIRNSTINELIKTHFIGINKNSLSVVGSKGRNTKLENYKIEYDTITKIKELLPIKK